MRPYGNQKGRSVLDDSHHMIRVKGTQVESGWQAIVEGFGITELLNKDFGGVDVGKALRVGGCQGTLYGVDGRPDGTCR